MYGSHHSSAQRLHSYHGSKQAVINDVWALGWAAGVELVGAAARAAGEAGRFPVGGSDCGPVGSVPGDVGDG